MDVGVDAESPQLPRCRLTARSSRTSRAALTASRSICSDETPQKRSRARPLASRPSWIRAALSSNSRSDLSGRRRRSRSSSSRSNSTLIVDAAGTRDTLVPEPVPNLGPKPAPQVNTRSTACPETGENDQNPDRRNPASQAKSLTSRNPPQLLAGDHDPPVGGSSPSSGIAVASGTRRVRGQKGPIWQGSGNGPILKSPWRQRVPSTA